MKSLLVKIQLFTLPLIAWTNLLNAQTSAPETDAVYLNSGQVYRGLIIEQRPGASIRLWRAPQGDTLSFDMDIIDRITKITASSAPMVETLVKSTPTKIFRTNTKSWATALQVMVGGGDHSVGGAGIVVQRRLDNNRSWAGLGLTFVGDVNNYGTHALGIIAHGSHEFSSGWNNRLGALAFMDLGYSYNLGGEYIDDQSQSLYHYGNGLHLFTGLRFRLNVLHNAGIWLDMGFLRHTSKIRAVEDNAKIGTKGWNMINFRGSIFF